MKHKKGDMVKIDLRPEGLIKPEADHANDRKVEDVHGENIKVMDAANRNSIWVHSRRVVDLFNME